jgi:hypothetical protein
VNEESEVFAEGGGGGQPLMPGFWRKKKISLLLSVPVPSSHTHSSTEFSQKPLKKPCQSLDNTKASGENETVLQ